MSKELLAAGKLSLLLHDDDDEKEERFEEWGAKRQRTKSASGIHSATTMRRKLSIEYVVNGFLTPIRGGGMGMTIGVPDDGEKNTEGEDGGARRPRHARLWLQLQSRWLPLWLGTHPAYLGPRSPECRP